MASASWEEDVGGLVGMGLLPHVAGGGQACGTPLKEHVCRSPHAYFMRIGHARDGKKS